MKINQRKNKRKMRRRGKRRTRDFATLKKSLLCSLLLKVVSLFMKTLLQSTRIDPLLKCKLSSYSLDNVMSSHCPVTRLRQFIHFNQISIIPKAESAIGASNY